MRKNNLWSKAGKICVGMTMAVILAGCGFNGVLAEENETEIAAEVNDGIVNVYDAEKVFSAEPYKSEAEPEVEIGSGTVTAENGEYTYQYTAPRSGRYYVKMTDVNVNCYLTTYVLDSLGNKAGEIWGKGGGGVMVQLEEGETYTIKVSRDQDYDTSFSVSIIAQKEPLDVSELSEVQDQISFPDQRNIYYFTPKMDGYYRFDLSNMTANITFDFMMWDSYDTNIMQIWEAEEGYGKTLELEAGTTYQIQIRQDRGVGRYTLHIYQQKEMVDVTGYTEINDSVEMSGQKIRYEFVVPETGVYRFGLTNLRSQFEPNIIVWDQNTKTGLARNDNLGGYEINDNFKNGVSLEKGQKCAITINEDGGLGDYTITIDYPKEAYDFLKSFKSGSTADKFTQENGDLKEETTEIETEDPELQRLQDENENMKNELSEMQKQYEELRQLMSENGIISDEEETETES